MCEAGAISISENFSHLIIVQLKGGLGNQLFQYAAGLSLAAHRDVPLKVDVSLLKSPDELIGTMRNFELQHLQNPPEVATENEISCLKNQHFFRKYFDKLRPSYQRSVYNEKRFHFDENFFSAGKNIYLKGYRQSEKYFRNIEEKIRDNFQFKKELIEDVIEFGQQLSNQNSVSIHIRRGDYKNSTVLKYHGIITPSYYQEAIDLIISKIENPAFLIFSDDMDWVQNNLNFPKHATFVSGKISHTHYQDFYLMSQCRHNIIANSSFSWWAAWLNDNPKKIVIAPKKWFGNAPNDTKDLIPESWIKI